MNVASQDQTDRDQPERAAADRWFLSRGLPAMVRPQSLLRQVWSRSAPALAGFATIPALSIPIVALSGEHTVDIAGRPDLQEGVILALVAVIAPAAALVGALVSRIASAGGRAIAGVVAVAVMALGAVFGGPTARIPMNFMVFGIAVAIILALTASGLGAILGWVANLTLSNLRLTLGMFVRALPVVLLTFLVFFNTYVWLMTALISRGRLWLGLGFLFLVASAFLVSTTMDQVRPFLSAPDAVPESDAAGLAGTPFADIADPARSDPLSLRERANIVFVLAASQIVHVLTVAVLTGAVFMVLGLILVTPEVLDAWTRGTGRADGQLLGMTLPIPDPLIQTTMVLSAITFMYLAAKAVTDTQYRAQFVDPMLANLRVNLLARNRYRTSHPSP
ncbi:MAG: hypothetical protein ACOYBX_05435 [Mycobacterium sp.]